MMEDLLELGFAADQERARVTKCRIVTYCLGDQCPLPPELVVRATSPISATGVEFLRAVAETRLFGGAEHVQVDVEFTGLKLAQVALAFGADDIVGTKVAEKDLRRIIRDAGFVPKRRDGEFRTVYI